MKQVCYTADGMQTSCYSRHKTLPNKPGSFCFSDHAFKPARMVCIALQMMSGEVSCYSANDFFTEAMCSSLNTCACKHSRELCVALQMVCSRCPATADMSFASDAVASGSQQGPSGIIQGQGTCSNCHLPWTACLKPRLVHAHSNVLASIKTEGCHPLDLLPSLMGAQCGNCSAAASLR